MAVIIGYYVRLSVLSRLDCWPLPVSIETTSVSPRVDLEAAGHPASTITDEPQSG